MVGDEMGKQSEQVMNLYLLPFMFILLLSPGCGGGGDPDPGQNNQKPLAITNAATSTSTSTSILNGNANPNGQATVAHFEWGQDPNLAGAASTPDQAIGNGITSIAIAVPLSGLAAATTYYYRVVATSTAGTGNGSIASLTTATPNAPPTVQTLGATGITTGGVTLNGNANPNGQATVAHFEWGQDPNLAGAASTPDQAIGNGITSIAIAVPLSGLAAATTYYYRVVATSTAGTGNGSIASLTTATPNAPPTVQTLGATGITTGGVTLNGNANPNGQATVAHFEWGQDPNLAGAASTPDQAIGNGITSIAIAVPLSGLAAATTYYYRVVATSTAGTGNGSIASLTTATPNAPPTVQTLGATGITTGGVTLNGNANPNGQATVAHFLIGEGDPTMVVGSISTPDQAIGSGSVGVSISAPLDDLIASTTYYFRLVATNSEGTSWGPILSFTSFDRPTPNEGIIFSKLFSVFGGSGIFSLDFYPITEYGSGGYISIRVSDTPTTYFEFSTLNASDPSTATFTKVRKGFVVDSVPFPFPYSQRGTYPIRISMEQTLATVEAFGGTASLTRNESSNPLIYFEVWTSDQDAYYDNIKMEPGLFDDFSSDTTGTYNLHLISGANSTFSYDPVGHRAWVRTGN